MIIYRMPIRVRSMRDLIVPRSLHLPTSVFMAPICSYFHINSILPVLVIFIANPYSISQFCTLSPNCLYCMALLFNCSPHRPRPHTLHHSFTILVISPCTVLHFQFHLAPSSQPITPLRHMTSFLLLWPLLIRDITLGEAGI